MATSPLSPAQESEALELATRVQQAIDKEVLQMARLLVGKAPRELFGQTEFDVRDLSLRIGAKAYELLLAEKKTVTRDPASSARTASKRRSSRTTGRRRL